MWREVRINAAQLSREAVDIYLADKAPGSGHYTEKPDQCQPGRDSLCSSAKVHIQTVKKEDRSRGASA